MDIFFLIIAAFVVYLLIGNGAKGVIAVTLSKKVGCICTVKDFGCLANKEPYVFLSADGENTFGCAFVCYPNNGHVHAVMRDSQGNAPENWCIPLDRQLPADFTIEPLPSAGNIIKWVSKIRG